MAALILVGDHAREVPAETPLAYEAFERSVLSWLSERHVHVTVWLDRSAIGTGPAYCVACQSTRRHVGGGMEAESLLPPRLTCASRISLGGVARQQRGRDLVRERNGVAPDWFARTTTARFLRRIQVQGSIDPRHPTSVRHLRYPLSSRATPQPRA